MAYLDEEGFAKEAEAAGYTKEAIAAHIAKIRASDAAEKHDTVTRMLAPAAAASAAVAQPVVTPPAPTPAPVAAAPALPAITGKTTPAELFNMRRPGSAVERMGGMIGEAGTAAGNTASNATQDSLDYARNAIANNPELTGALAAIPVLYGANKLGLFDNLGSKMSASAAQPFVGGAGPRVTPPAPVVTPSASPIQNWDIHNEPALFAPTPAATPATTAAATPSRNLTLEEAQARLAGVTPSAAPTRNVTAGITPAPVVPEAAVPAMTEVPKPVAPTPAETSAAMPSRPVTPTPTAVLPERVQNAIKGVPKTVQEQYAKEGKVVLKGYGVGDRSLTNTYGIPAYAKIIDYFNEGKPIGDDANYQIIRKKINQGVPASLAAEFAAKLPGSEAEAGNFGKAFGETGAYTKDGKIVTSPAAMKKAVAGGGALFLATALPNIVNAATSATRTGNVGPLVETAFDVGIGAIPYVGTAAAALTGSTLQSGKLFNENPYTEVLNRSGVRDVLANMRKTMSPDEFNVAREQYLSKLSSFPEYNSSRFTKPAIGSTQPINRTTLLPIAPPAR